MAEPKDENSLLNLCLDCEMQLYTQDFREMALR